jgi:hypothetical protein
MIVTGKEVIFDDAVTSADAHGNNVAWCCPLCKHPVLFVCRKDQKGFNNKYTVCKGCKKKYTIIPEDSGSLRILQEK